MRLALAAIVFFATPAAFAETQAVVVYVQGTVKIVKAGGGEAAAQLGSEVNESDTLVTEDASQVRVRLFDRSLVRLGGNSRAQLSQLRFDGAEKKTISVKLVFGKLWASVSKLVSSDSRFEVSTTSAVAGVRGTEFAVLLQDPDGDCNVTTAEGSVAVRARDGSERLIGAGFEAVIGQNGFRDVRQVSSESITALRNESRGGGEGPSGGTAGRGDVEARMERAMEQARERFGNERPMNANPGQERNFDRGDRLRIGGEQSVAEQRQRARDVFEQINARAAATRLRAIIDIRE